MTINPGQTIYTISRKCPNCGSLLATDGKRIWCVDEFGRWCGYFAGTDELHE